MNLTPSYRKLPMFQIITKYNNVEDSSTSSYANVTFTTMFPRKDQAIILNSIDGITRREYITVLSRNIRFVAWIYNAWICVSGHHEDSILMVKGNYLKNNILEIKPHIQKNKRMVLSNVCPVIPYSIIEQKLKEISITTILS